MQGNVSAHDSDHGPRARKIASSTLIATWSLGFPREWPTMVQGPILRDW